MDDTSTKKEWLKNNPGLTQRSHVRETKSGQIAHFNHPFEMTLFNSSSKEEEIGGRPRLFVEVCRKR